ncbi:hypothetical protein KM043_000784 [Ampulex compressa]|nr:hypothetical protein KM043_000784 [Ampulex compressa]
MVLRCSSMALPLGSTLRRVGCAFGMSSDASGLAGEGGTRPEGAPEWHGIERRLPCLPNRNALILEDRGSGSSAGRDAKRKSMALFTTSERRRTRSYQRVALRVAAQRSTNYPCSALFFRRALAALPGKKNIGKRAKIAVKKSRKEREGERAAVGQEEGKERLVGEWERGAEGEGGELRRGPLPSSFVPEEAPRSKGEPP